MISGVLRNIACAPVLIDLRESASSSVRQWFIKLAGFRRKGSGWVTN